MAGNEGAPVGSRKKEIRFGDGDAGASLPQLPADISPPKGEKATLVEWAKQAGHVPPPIPRGGYARRGDRFKGFDVRILLVHMKAHATPDKPFYENALYTREEYDALVKEAQGVACGSASPMRDQVEALEAHAGGFRERAKTEAPKAEES